MGVAFLIVLLVGGLLAVAVVTILVISLWRLKKRPSKGVAMVDLVIAFAFGLWLLRAVHWWATGNLRPREWPHLAIPFAGLAIFGALAALHHRAIRRDPLRL